MDLSKYGINAENIKSVLKQYLEEKVGNESWDIEKILLN
jgi:hypothetical protein